MSFSQVTEESVCPNLGQVAHGCKIGHDEFTFKSSNMKKAWEILCDVPVTFMTICDVIVMLTGWAIKEFS